MVALVLKKYRILNSKVQLTHYAEIFVKLCDISFVFCFTNIIGGKYHDISDLSSLVGFTNGLQNEHERERGIREILQPSVKAEKVYDRYYITEQELTGVWNIMVSAMRIILNAL